MSIFDVSYAAHVEAVVKALKAAAAEATKAPEQAEQAESANRSFSRGRGLEDALAKAKGVFITPDEFRSFLLQAVQWTREDPPVGGIHLTHAQALGLVTIATEKTGPRWTRFAADIFVACGFSLSGI